MSYPTRKQTQQMINESINKAFLPNLKMLETMFGNFKAGDELSPEVERGAIKNIREIDRIQAIHRFKWKGLPNITSLQLERMLYEKGQVMMFYVKETDKYYYLPFSLCGTIDVYGRYNSVKPVPMGSTASDDKSVKEEMEKLKTSNPTLYELLNNAIREIVKSEEDISGVEGEKEIKCVIISDRTPGISETIVARMILSKEIIEFQAETIPLLRTTLINDTGTKAMRVNNADEAANVMAANIAKVKAAKTGQGYVPVIGPLEFQDMNAGGTAQTTEFLQSYQAIDNIRKSWMGVGSGAAFEKEAHVLEKEQEMNTQSSQDVLDDGEECRNISAELANKLFGLSIAVESQEKQADEMDIEEEQQENEGGQEND